jgi:Putative zinc-finger
MRKDACTKPEFRSWIHHLILGDLPAFKGKRLERHISACPACQIEKEFFLICKKLPTNRLYDLTYIRKI